MGVKDEINEKLQRLLDLVEGEDRAVKALERNLERVEKQNVDLFNRLMARKFEDYAMHSEGKGIVAETFEELAPEADEGMAGEAMEISDDTSK